jgi:hypothetical protein
MDDEQAEQRDTDLYRDKELVRSHSRAVMIIYGLMIFVVLCFAIASILSNSSIRSPQPSLVGALWIGIVLCGIGAVTLRRTRFSSMRLVDIKALQGTSGLISTLEKTTILVASLSGLVSIMGLLISFQTGNNLDMIRAAVVAIAILFYSYPRLSAWQRVVQRIESIAESDMPAKGRIS